MKFSIAFAPTLKESPSEAEVVSHKLLMRAGMIRKVAAGIYTFLPLGYNVIKKIERIVREEMARAGAQELLMPVLQPSDLWRITGHGKLRSVKVNGVALRSTILKNNDKISLGNFNCTFVTL